MKCDICHEGKDTVRMLYYKANAVMQACTDCISISQPVNGIPDNQIAAHRSARG